MRKNLFTSFVSAAAALSLLFVACEPADDGAEEKRAVVSFSASSVTVTEDDAEATVVVKLSEAINSDVDVAIEIAADDAAYYTASTQSVTIAKGATSAEYTVAINWDAIPTAGTDITATIATDDSYDIDATAKSCTIKCAEKAFPVIGFSEPTVSVKSNATTATVTVELTNDAFENDIEVELAIESDVDGAYSVDGDLAVTLAAGETSVDFTLNLDCQFITPAAGFDITVSIVDGENYDLATDSEAVISIENYSADVSKFLLKEHASAAWFGLPGYYIWQKLRNNSTDPDDSWSTGAAIALSEITKGSSVLTSLITPVKMGTSSYEYYGMVARDVLSLRKMFLDIDVIFPDDDEDGNSDYVFAGYGTDDKRFFSNLEEYLRLTPSENDRTKGTVSTLNNQTITLSYGLRSVWDDREKIGEETDEETGEVKPIYALAPWIADSMTTLGDVSKSSLATLGTIELTLVKIEGTFDFSAEAIANKEAIVFKAWLKCDSEYFAKGVEAAKANGIVVDEEDGCYVVEYAMYPKA